MASQQDTVAPNYKQLGRLAALGPQEPWQVALLLPERIDDMACPVQQARQLEEKLAKPIMLRLITSPSAVYGRGVPRLTFQVTDRAGEQYRATIFGDTKAWLEQLAGVDEACFMATAKEWSGQLQLTIEEKVEDRWIGRQRPRYPARRQVITDEAARSVVLRHLASAIPQAAKYLADELGKIAPLTGLLSDCGAHGWTLEQVLYQAHLPASAAHGAHAHKVMRRLSGLAALNRMHGSSDSREPNPIDMRGVEARMAQMPWALTNDQVRAIRETAKLMEGRKRPAHVLVAGDVGVGKTAVAAVLVATVATAPGRQHRAMVLSPNAPLAEQLYREMQQFFPDLDIRLVTGDTPSNTDLSAAVLVGTSALLYRDVGVVGIDLVICDEQQRFSRDQREQHVGPKTHLVELTATPIPRTQALVRYGRVACVEMRQTARPKTFVTRMFCGKSGARDLFAELMPALDAGEPLLVVYPKREAGEEQSNAAGIDGRHSVETAVKRWETMFPGQVASLTSEDGDEQKARVLDALGTGRTKILVCTTVVEIGLNINGLHQIVIVCPERHGLMALHQLRGRTARHGGEGLCYLLCPEPLNPEQVEKLELFCATTDGFALADYDMRRRGAGDLSPNSEKQSGADNTFLMGTKLDVETLDEVLPIWERWMEYAQEDAKQ